LQEAEVERTRAELSLLKAQVNPHFFFNTLNSLYALSLDRSERVPEVILKLSALMRYVLEGSNREETALEDELSFIEDYVELEKLRISGNPDIRVEKKGDLSGKLIAPMILVPFVENGFKHGINTMVGDGYLLIRLKVEEGNLEFVVKNSRTAGKPDSTGMGLKNVKRRLELLYPGSHDLSIHERDDWFEIGLRIKP
ncbi:MAG: histidine kinase, partial [Planctomycetota bacterium]